MNAQAALKKTEDKATESEKGKDWRSQLTEFMMLRGDSVARIAGKLGVGVSTLERWLSGEDFPGLAAAVKRLLRREEDYELISIKDEEQVKTSAFKIIWDVCEFAHEMRTMALISAPSGIGKTTSLISYRRSNSASVYVCMDVTCRSAGNLIHSLIKRTGSASHSRTMNELLERFIFRMKDSERLIILDDAHFLSWDQLEVVRRIHDASGTGIIFAGQPRLYDVMRGSSNSSYLYDQIYSRVAIKRETFEVTRQDVRLLADSICPGLDKLAVDFLFDRAQGQGRFRIVMNILKVALRVHERHGAAMDRALLEDAALFLMT